LAPRLVLSTGTLDSQTQWIPSGCGSSCGSDVLDANPWRAPVRGPWVPLGSSNLSVSSEEQVGRSIGSISFRRDGSSGHWDPRGMPSPQHGSDCNAAAGLAACVRFVRRCTRVFVSIPLCRPLAGPSPRIAFSRQLCSHRHSVRGAACLGSPAGGVGQLAARSPWLARARARSSAALVEQWRVEARCRPRSVPSSTGSSSW
jgi:hypothetical protein